MTTVYQQCPFCERVFELGPADYQPMKQHIRIMHTQPGEGHVRSEPIKNGMDLG